MALRPVGKIGVYGPKTRALQRRLSYEAFGLTSKVANVYMYLGSAESDVPDITDIQTKVFFEVPDRAYASEPVPIPVGMERYSEYKADYSRFAYIDPLQNETTFRFHVDDFIPMGRDMVVGDVFEVPFYEHENGLAFWEVTDVDLKSEAEKFIAVVSATPLSKSRATRDIPVDRDNEDLMDLIRQEQEAEMAEDVPAEGVHFDEPAQEEVDYRNFEQADFLDDPTKSL